jgi:hypothetical protein
LSTQFNQSDYIYLRSIDWPTVIMDLRRVGLSYAQVSRSLGIPPTTLQSWREGHEPRHAVGNGLLLYHAQQCGKHKTRRRVLEAEPQA